MPRPVVEPAIHPEESRLVRANFFPLAALRHNLKRLLVIRSIVLALQVSALVYARLEPALDLPYAALGALLGLSAALNVAVLVRLRLGKAVTEGEFLGHLLLDIAVLFLLLYFSGGASNPFVSYFLVPITISAAILPWPHTWLVAGASLLAYTVLLFFYRPLPAMMPDLVHGPAIANPHTAGMWFNFLVSAGLITWFVVKMATELRLREEKLSRHREDDLRDEQILAVATQAAGTAHELGTPLSTAAILLTEMEREYAGQEGLIDDLRLLREQIERCRGTLKDLVSRADIRRQGTPRRIALRQFIHALAEQWQLLRPEVTLELHVAGVGPDPLMAAESTLQQAIVNILNNAADASPAGIDGTLDWGKERWSLRIRDYGEGIDPQVAARIGSDFVSTKDDGLGVGLLISQATINHMGGRVSLYPHAEGGTVTEIVLPLEGNADGG